MPAAVTFPAESRTGSKGSYSWLASHVLSVMGTTNKGIPSEKYQQENQHCDCLPNLIPQCHQLHASHQQFFALWSNHSRVQSQEHRSQGQLDV